MRNVLLMARADADLIREARAGSSDAFEALYSCHRPHALREARRHTNFDPDDVVSEAFASVFRAISAGGGPDSEFRAYLRMAVKNAAVQMSRRPTTREIPTDIEAESGATPTFSSTFDDDEMYLASVVDDSLGLLPDRWMQVLWATEVEGRKPRDIGREMHMSANSVAALTKRARQGFRAEFAKQLNERTEELHRLADIHRDAYDAGTLSPMTAALLNAHIDSCALCSEQPMAVSRVVAWPVAIWLGATGSSGVAAIAGGGAATAAVAGSAARRGVRLSSSSSGATNGTLIAAGAASLVALSVGVVAVVASDGGTEKAAGAAPTSITELVEPSQPDQVEDGGDELPGGSVNATPDGERSDSLVINEIAPNSTTSTTVSVAPPPVTIAPAPPTVVSRPAAAVSSRPPVPVTTLAEPVPSTEPIATTAPETTVPETITTPATTVLETTTTTAPATTTPATTTPATTTPATTTTLPSQTDSIQVRASSEGPLVRVAISLLTDSNGARPVTLRITSDRPLTCDSNCSSDGDALLTSATNWHIEQPVATVALVDVPQSESAALYLSASVDGVVVLAQSYTIFNH